MAYTEHVVYRYRKLAGKFTLTHISFLLLGKCICRDRESVMQNIGTFCTKMCDNSDQTFSNENAGLLQQSTYTYCSALFGLFDSLDRVQTTVENIRGVHSPKGMKISASSPPIRWTPFPKTFLPTACNCGTFCAVYFYTLTYVYNHFTQQRQIVSFCGLLQCNTVYNKCVKCMRYRQVALLLQRGRAMLCVRQ